MELCSQIKNTRYFSGNIDENDDIKLFSCLDAKVVQSDEGCKDGKRLSSEFPYVIEAKELDQLSDEADELRVPW